MKRGSAAGFTLLEVMLAILLLALLLAGSYGAIRTAVHAMHSGESAIDRTNRLRVAQEFMRHQISRIMPLPFGRDESTNTNLIFEGRRDFIRFVAPMPGYLSKGGPYVQTLAFKGGRGGRQLLFNDEMLNGFDPEAKSDNEPSLLLDQIEEGHFEFRTLDENGELTDWSDDWDDPSMTPVMIRIVARMSPEARVEFPPMDIPLMLDAGSARRQQPFQTFGARSALKPVKAR
ncbi:prepilin-type N-terminal cleavage/methylation domain-containing protein [Dokdonella fugitiva]|jgi:general secretion pathway protein J|uniref:General secretion pathway protein J n=1 Tax=Dokdonella fugitiva TaxID=328517 RepID=A0A4R2IDM2_9GAMM|nr:prepilin-type N-terminal cleavage/methylation domain-containing protein [Dokdonella fugitiva]MBA8882488.1 general secretion pathway protein J [Dokdonella fugitiva]TCO42713.1 general secretion pathway protein J [Dokdonella fugitiva]